MSSPTWASPTGLTRRPVRPLSSRRWLACSQTHSVVSYAFWRLTVCSSFKAMPSATRPRRGCCGPITPSRCAPLVRMFGLPVTWASWEALQHTVETGLPAAEKVVPGGFWAYFASHPEASSIFNAAMTAKAHGQVAGVVAAYDFSGFGRIGDVGGGRGHLLRAVLDSAPQASGVLCDLPDVLREVSGLASERLKLQAGDFFKDPLPICDAYLMMEVIHDWGDEKAVAILKAVRRPAPPEAKLLVIEQIVPDDPGPHWTKTLDIHMLALLGGRQRTREQYEVLCANADFALARQIDTAAGISILEAVPV